MIRIQSSYYPPEWEGDKGAAERAAAFNRTMKHIHRETKKADLRRIRKK